MTRKAPRFELDPAAPPANAARDAALAQLDHALASLESHDAEAIHEARKVCKKLRALLRLIRPFLGRAYRTENTRLRDVGHVLSQGREAAVLVETADTLFGGDAYLEPLAERVRERPRPESSVSRRKAEQLLNAERRRVVDWPIRELSAANLILGLLESYRRARRAYREAREQATPLALHEWRKQAKYHGYQSALVRPLWPVRKGRIERLKELSDLLGEHHDLQVLAMTLQRSGKTFASRTQLRAARKCIDARQRKLAARALRLGKELFGTRPLDWLEKQPAK